MPMRLTRFTPDPIDLTPLRRTVRRVAIRPEHRDECQRIITHAIADLEAVEVVPGDPVDEVAPSQAHRLSMFIDRRHRLRRGGYWQSPLRFRGHLSVVHLATRPLSEWTAETVGDVIAAARAALVARGATGRCRVALRFDDTYAPESAVLCVRMGRLRARVDIDKGGCWCQRLSSDLLEVLRRAIG